MKKVLLSCVFLVVIAAGCTSEEQDNLTTYVNDDVHPIASLEQEAVSEYESVTGNNYQDDQTLHTALTDTIIPSYEEFVDGLEDIDVADEEISQAHDTYVEGANKQLEAFHSFVEALEAQDANQVEEANVTLEEGHQNIREYRTSIQDLADERDVEIDMEG